jgi:hypothetical protein
MTELERRIFERRVWELDTEQPMLRLLGALTLFLLAIVAFGLIVLFYLAHPPLPATVAGVIAAGVGIPLFLLGRRHARARRR